MDGILSLRRCREYEIVFLGRGRETKDFFYFYSCLILDIHVDNFTMEVLRVLNVTPTQLHLNSCVALQVFRLLCDVLSLKATPRSILHYFGMRPGDRIIWVSLDGQSKTGLFTPFTTSYKNLKESFFKVIIKEEGRQLFYDGETPRFPFYWKKGSNTISYVVEIPDYRGRPASVIGFGRASPQDPNLASRSCLLLSPKKSLMLMVCYFTPLDIFLM